MYYFPSQPPYLLLAFGLFTAVTSGAALSGTLQSLVGAWQNAGAENSEIQLTKKPLIFPFLGITLGVGVFLVSGLEIFGFPPLLAYGVGLPMGILTCLLIWLQLGSMMTFMQSRGMSSLDLDSMS
ncbi:hypothetical protein [Calothrix sp. NIES-3974]|uniref:hypothetical protein n=1 Tax=Calothrix sp. NIES-3974 TaxID=2005462 RepID=UPI000B5E6218|nr:hypothetical protein [Calothrix sp. NIES-3974]BAZ03809.1 hypothetical protein NIES3974_04390 [Calothrix sp. NIES-3974]